MKIIRIGKTEFRQSSREALDYDKVLDGGFYEIRTKAVPVETLRKRISSAAYVRDLRVTTHVVNQNAIRVHAEGGR